MNLSIRAAVDSDFEGFWSACYSSFGFGEEIKAGVRREWRMLLGNPSTISVIVENRECESVAVACAIAAFVTEDFARRLWTDMPPYVNARLLEDVERGAQPFVAGEAVRIANSRGGLHALLTHWGWSEELLSESDALVVREYLTRTMLTQYRGFRLKTMSMEVVGHRAREMAANSGLSTIRDFQECPGIANLSPEMRPWLMGITREQAIVREGCAVCAAFVYDPPRFYFHQREQELLQLALQKDSDDAIAEALGISTPAVKKRWRTVFARVAEVDSTFLPEGMEGVRGPEKRCTLIRYLHDHPEELRPIEPETTLRAPKGGGRGIG